MVTLVPTSEKGKESAENEAENKQAHLRFDCSKNPPVLIVAAKRDNDTSVNRNIRVNRLQ